METYKITNISGHRLCFSLELINGDTVVDYLEIDEVCYNVSKNAAFIIEKYVSKGLLKIESEDHLSGVDWINCGF